MVVRQYSVFMRFLERSLALTSKTHFHVCSIQPLCYKVRSHFRPPKTDKYKKRFIVWKGIKIKELAESMEMKPQDVMEAICRVLKTEQRLTYSTEIDDITLLSEVAKLCGGLIKEKHAHAEEFLVDKDVYRRKNFDVAKLKYRPPVVTIMGHVDHGKTTLLDSLRSSRIVDSEFGGITQHIGAFKVSLSEVSEKHDNSSKNQIVTFLDTPGHAAFSAMRARGAHCTDIVVLVVAIEDGIMPQTLESIRFAKEAKVPIIVAVNKLDRIWKKVEDLNSSNFKQTLAPLCKSLGKHGIVVEQYGGDVQCIPISALKKWNLHQLQESILALAETLQLRADYEGDCESVVLEAHVSEGLGKVATVLVQQGRLRTGLVFVAGNTYIKIRTIKSDRGEIRTQGNPGDPVEVTGWKNVLPEAGDVMIQVENEAKARDVLAFRKKKVDKIKSEQDFKAYEKNISAYRNSYKTFIADSHIKGIRHSKDRPNIMNFVHNEQIKNGIEIPKINLIIKTDVQGSLEAINSVLESATKSCSDQCLIKIAFMNVGNLTENDVELARITSSIIYMFNLPQNTSMKNKADIDIRHFNVIYHMFDDLKELITQQLPKLSECEVLGEAEVLKIFEIKEKSIKIPVCGSKCFKGTLYKNSLEYRYRVVSSNKDGEKNENIIKDNLSCRNMRHLKNDVDSIRKGVECGICLNDENKEYYLAGVGDIIQCYKIVTVSQNLIWDLGFTT